MPTRRLRITATVPIHGRKPGEEFEIETDADGIPLQLQWRKRLADEERYHLGAVTIVSAPAVSEPRED